MHTLTEVEPEFPPMKVHLTFDTEIWCGSWNSLDARFPAAFARYIYGRSPAGDFGLPEILRVLARHRLRGVFFVEPLFSGRFGLAPLKEIVDLVATGNHEVQLHLHPEWVDEMHEAPVCIPASKRQHLIEFDQSDQAALIAWGVQRLKEAGAGPVSAFRGGNYACNDETLAALAGLGIRIDSSVNASYAHSGGSLRDSHRPEYPFCAQGVTELPITVFQDGSGHPRHAQIGACSFRELKQALEAAHRQGRDHFVIVAHSFELIKPGTCLPDRVVARRFRALCAYLARHPDRYEVAGFGHTAEPGPTPDSPLCVSSIATGLRYAEQGLRRVLRRFRPKAQAPSPDAPPAPFSASTPTPSPNA